MFLLGNLRLIPPHHLGRKLIPSQAPLFPLSMAEESQRETNPPNQQSPESLSALPKGKMEWPELIGLTAEEAEKKIKEEKEGVKVQVVQPGSFVTMDYREDRVRVYVGTSGKVERAPRIG